MKWLLWVVLGVVLGFSFFLTIYVFVLRPYLIAGEIGGVLGMSSETSTSTNR